jgi:hypothetical protein
MILEKDKMEDKTKRQIAKYGQKFSALAIVGGVGGGLLGIILPCMFELPPPKYDETKSFQENYIAKARYEEKRPEERIKLIARGTIIGDSLMGLGAVGVVYFSRRLRKLGYDPLEVFSED